MDEDDDFACFVCFYGFSKSTGYMNQGVFWGFWAWKCVKPGFGGVLGV
jgi:hypothetical protein